ncbi:ArsR/SmtB family transcription factor [Brevibacillus massiliensis]|jgi:ArsR family transcriptional regulator|uniref:ArsR/SmtB family transcription factor n=1 Tax=Brevibacillus massiliensis TaxID=1118054 RepID=UPI00037F2373|nr:metalloregulator ArsR/SmtB family transcription factor [Brevibacillus massiliensis]
MDSTDMMQILLMAELFKLLGDKTRLTIMALLHAKSLCVRDLVEILQASQPSVSQHLAKLRMQGLVKETRKGPWVYYSVSNECQPMMELILEQLPDLKHVVANAERDKVSVVY